MVKKESQNLDQHRLNLIIVEKGTQELEQSQKQDLHVISKGQIRRIAIDHELYNHTFKKFLYYNWVQSSLVPRYNIKNHKKNRFHQIPRNHNLFYTPIT